MNLDLLLENATRECGLSADDPVLVGVSGGPDSLCLVSGLTRLGFSLVIAHFDHQLRPESRSDADKVKLVAEQLGLPFVLGGEDVAGFASHRRVSIEDAARTLRYQFLFTQARKYRVQAVAVGHTADDQVETLLMHLIRGTGINGLTGMRYRSIIEAWDSTIPLVRPLLSFWREETLMCCQEAGLDPVMDASNLDRVFFRNRIRHELLPLLETYNPKVRQALWRTASLISGEEGVVREAVEKAWVNCLVRILEQEVQLALPVLKNLSPGLRRGVLRKAASQVLPTLKDVDFAAIQRADQWIDRSIAGQIEFVQGVRVFIEQDCLIIARANRPASKAFWPQVEDAEEQILAVPGQVQFSSGWQITCDRVERDDLLEWICSNPPTAWEAYVDAASLREPVAVRKPRSGDRFQPLGMQGHFIKLSDFWTNRKHPRRARAGWPLLVAGNQIVWVPGFQPAESSRIRENTRVALHFRLDRVS